MLDVFCYPCAITTADGTLEELGVWKEFPAVLPVGSDVAFEWPSSWQHGPLSLLIAQYQLEEDGSLWCRCDWGVRAFSPLKVTTDMQTTERELRSVGWIHFREAMQRTQQGRPN